MKKDLVTLEAEADHATVFFRIRSIGLRVTRR